MVVRGALPRDPDAQLPNFSWDLLVNHKCDPSTQKTAGIMIPALTFLLGSDQHPSCGPGLVGPLLSSVIVFRRHLAVEVVAHYV